MARPAAARPALTATSRPPRLRSLHRKEASRGSSVSSESTASPPPPAAVDSTGSGHPRPRRQSPRVRRELQMEIPESGVEQRSEPEVTEKYVEMGINVEKLTDEMQGLEVNQKPVLGSVVETREKQTDVEPTRDINQKPAKTCQDAVETEETNPEEKQQTSNPAGVIYRCKKCRRMVATQEYVVTHKVGSGESRFYRHKTDDKQPECTPAIFVEPMKWMEAVEEGHVSHKLWCMDCKTRLGSFDWAGMQCSCGAWVIPAFQLLRSRIDECQM